MYKTKTQKRNALRSLKQKSLKLMMSDFMSVTDAKKINDIADRYMKKL